MALLEFSVGDSLAFIVLEVAVVLVDRSFLRTAHLLV